MKTSQNVCAILQENQLLLLFFLRAASDELLNHRLTDSHTSISHNKLNTAVTPLTVCLCNKTEETI